MKIPGNPGIYVMVGCLSHELRIELRSVGIYDLHPGIYCYCGSAKGPGGLRARVNRHMNKETSKFWHFDYLKENLRMLQIWWQTGKDAGECEIAQFLSNQKGAQIPVSGFGSSDCRNACVSHLIYFKDERFIYKIFQDTGQHGFTLARKILLV